MTATMTVDHVNLESNETMDEQLWRRFVKTAWACGDLRSAAVAVGLTCAVSTGLLTVYYVESQAASGPFSMEVVVIGLLALFTGVTDCSLVYGATQRRKLLLVPWMAVHMGLVLFLSGYTAVNFADLVGHRIVAFVFCAVLVYFYVLVALFYRELRIKDLALAASQAVEEAPPEQKELLCLGDVRSKTQVSAENDDPGAKLGSSEVDTGKRNPFRDNEDDTFTQLANRTPLVASTPSGKGSAISKARLRPMTVNTSWGGGPLDDSGEFALPASAASDKAFRFDDVDGFPNLGREAKLPTPDEVICLRNGFSKDGPPSQPEEGPGGAAAEVDQELVDDVDDAKDATPPPTTLSFIGSTLRPYQESENGDGGSGSAGVSRTSLSDVKAASSAIATARPKTGNRGAISQSVTSLTGRGGHQASGDGSGSDAAAHPAAGKAKNNPFFINMDLVDSSFTPYKKKSKSNGHIILPGPEPKLKIFLPRNDKDDDDDDDDSVSSEGEGDPEQVPLSTQGHHK